MQTSRAESEKTKKKILMILLLATYDANNNKEEIGFELYQLFVLSMSLESITNLECSIFSKVWEIKFGQVNQHFQNA